MNGLTMAGFIVMILVDVALIAIVLLQPSKDGSGADGMLSGSMENFFGKNRSRTLEGKLSNITKWLAVSFGVLCVGLVLLLRFLG